MPCSIIRPRPVTNREIARLWQSNGDEYPFTRSDDAFLDTVVDGGHPGDGPIFICGSGDAIDTCACGYMADLLCDWPVGGGKTCDLPLCSECSQHVGEEKDLCMLHFAMFAKEAKPARVFMKGPRLVK